MDWTGGTGSKKTTTSSGIPRAGPAESSKSNDLFSLPSYTQAKNITSGLTWGQIS